MHIESPPLNDEHTDRDVEADLDAERVHWRSGTYRRASSFKSGGSDPAGNGHVVRNNRHLH
jgi:hypothetical protein